VIMLLGAWATGRLSESIEMDAEPALEVRGGSVVLDLVEIKTKPAGGQAGLWHCMFEWPLSCPPI